jgi:hypothetical protein
MASNKFEEMLEKLVNEDKAGAEELFHEIVVEKSRDIYEGLLESDLEVDETTDEEVDETTDEEVDEASDEEVDEASDDDDKEEATNEDFNLDEFEVEGGDPADDMMDKMGMDMDGDAEGGDGMDMDMDAEGGEEEIEDRVDDLEVALDDLKAEFEKMMGDDNDDEGEEDEDDMDIDPDADAEEEPEEESYNFEASDEEVEEAADEETDESTKSEAETMREYVEKVTAKMGDNGANTKSTVASANNMGGTASNLVAGGEADTKGTTGGLAAPSEKEDNAGNVNVPGGKAAKSNKAMPKGHGAEKKGAGDTAANKKPVIGG